MDDDVISQGGDRAPAPWRRRLTVMAALATLVAGGAAYLALSPRPVSHRSSVTAVPTPTGSAALSLPAEPDGSVRAKGQPGV